MKVRGILKLIVGSTVVFGILPSAPSLASVTLPSGAGDFVPAIDLSSALSDLVQLGSTQCSVVSTNVVGLPVGDALTVPVDPIKGLTLVNALKSRSDSLVAMSCAQSISMAGTERNVTGTIRSDALGLFGSFILACTFQEDIKVTAELTAGLAVAKGVVVVVKSADRPIPMVCSMAATFPDGTSLSGTVDGLARVGTTDSDACTGDSQASCVPLAVDANVNITSTTGKLSGFTGSGVYSLAPSFTIPRLNEDLSLLKSGIGKSSVMSFAGRFQRLVPRMAPTDGKMSIKFSRGEPRTDIVHPSVKGGISTLGAGSYLAATGPRAAKCSFSVVRGKKTAVLTTVRTTSVGITPTKVLTAAQYGRLKKSLAAKSGTSVKLSVACGKTRATQSVTLG